MTRYTLNFCNVRFS